MRYISMHKANRDTEAGLSPSPQLIAGMGQLMEQMGAAGVLRGGEGLHATSKGVRIKLVNGQRKLQRGPFKSEHELIAGYLQMQTKTIDEAIDWAARYGAIFGDGEIDVRPMTEPWDLGFGAKPKELLTTRYMATRKADRKTEAGLVPTPIQEGEVERLLEHMKRAGVLLGAELFEPSSSATRLNYRNGQRVITDGPFAETKELIAGYCVFDVGSKAEVIAWSDRFAAVFGDVELDIRTFREKS